MNTLVGECKRGSTRKMPLRSTLRREAPATEAKAVEYIRNFAARWAKAKPPMRAAMIQSLYQEIVV
jgi:hypothetical protein